MQKRILGRTGMEVTAISFGGLPIQRCTMEESWAVLNTALDAGINFIDTARAYTDSEEKIGQSIASRRSEFFLATKSLARDKISMARDIDISLANMKTDRIDLYQLHNIRARKELEDVLAPGGALEALKEARKAGKIRFIGITGHNVELLVEAVKTGEFSTVQLPFNFVETKAIDELLPLAKSMNVGTIIMKPLGGGQLDNVDLALRFILEYDISTAIPGMDEVSHITQNLAALKNFRPLIAAERDELKREADAVGSDFCRRCGYCMPCTMGIDIPSMFIFHLQYTRYNMKTAIPERYKTLSVKASECSDCGLCETRCPYELPIREKLKKVAEDLG
jgi:predicted aldo/keto reductase-like oxidoreductase